MTKAVAPARASSDAPLEDIHDPLSGQPELLREIAEVAGVEAAITLADRRGGNRVYFPRPDTLGPHHWLVDCVGATPARLLCEHFYGIELELPIGTLSKTERQLRVQRLIALGWTSSEITRAVGCTRRTVKRNRSALRSRADGEQLDMFPEPLPPRLLSCDKHASGMMHEPRPLLPGPRRG